MVKMSEFEPFLKSFMLTDRDRIQILNEGESVPPEVTKFRTAVFQITVKLPNGSTKLWTMNKTTRSRCAASWGDDSKGWIGKWIQVTLSKQMIQGTSRDVIFGTPTEAPIVQTQQNIEFH